MLNMSQISGYVCRVCESTKDLETFSKNVNRNILLMLENLGCFKTKEDNRLLQHICRPCIRNLEAFHQFKASYSSTFAKFRMKIDQMQVRDSSELAISQNLSAAEIPTTNAVVDLSTSDGFLDLQGLASKQTGRDDCKLKNSDYHTEKKEYILMSVDNAEHMVQATDSLADANDQLVNIDITENIGQMTSIHSTRDESTSLCNNKLKILLQSWKQEHLLNTLIAENVDINILKIIKKHHIERLLKDFKLGDQILFEYNLDLWRQEIGLPLYASEAVKFYSVSSAATKNMLEQRLPRSSLYLVPSPSSSRRSSPETNSSCHITLSNILNGTHKGQIITEFYDKNKRLKDEHRVALINLIASYFEENHYHLSLKTSYRLEKEILEHFPSEKQELYRTGKRGRIYSRYCNAKQIIKKLHPMKTFKRESGSVKIINLSPEPDAEFCIKTLRYDNLSVQEFDTVWQSCRNFRLNEIHTMSCLSEVLSKWPEYKKSSGYRLIDLDFKGLHPESSSIIDGWEEESVKIKSFLLEKVHDKGILSTLSGLDDTEYNDDYFVLELLRSVHGFLIPTQRIPRTDNVGKKTLYKPTIRDSQDAFVFVGQSVREVEDHIELLSKQSDNIQPLLLVVRNDSHKKIHNIILLIDDIKLVFSSFLRAVDICFKSFFVFNISYPITCEQFWIFLEKHFYKADISDNKKSSKVVHMMEALLGTI